MSKNLWDEEYIGIRLDSPKYRSIYVGNGTFTLSTTTLRMTGDVADLFFLSGNVSTGASTANNGVWKDNPKTIESVDGYVTIAYRYFDNHEEADPRYNNTMLNTGSQPLPYEPYSSEVWHDIPHYIHNTSTDTLTTLPAVLYPNDTTATVGLKGNTVQNGTPTPTAPIQPSECGERTGNLFCVSQTNTATGGGITLSFTEGSSEILMSRRTTSSASSLDAPTNISLSAGTYTASIIGLSVITANAYDRIYISDSNNNVIVNNVLSDSPQSFTLASNTVISKITFVCDSTSTYNNQIIKIMLNSGSTAKPYEPHGYKIPILLNSQTINKYLGEVQTVRAIKKWVLTGQEDWTQSTTDVTYNRYKTNISDMRAYGTRLTPMYCTHYQNISDGRAISNVPNNSIYTGSGIDTYIKDTSFSSVADFKAFLADEYANGTPVVVYYVLATPQTATVNEPLMKIGTYADTFTTSIPVTAGENSLDVQTTVQPSEVSVNYHGWHPVQSVYERDSGAWT